MIGKFFFQTYCIGLIGQKPSNNTKPGMKNQAQSAVEQKWKGFASRETKGQLHCKTIDLFTVGINDRIFCHGFQGNLHDQFGCLCIIFSFCKPIV